MHDEFPLSHYALRICSEGHRLDNRNSRTRFHPLTIRVPQDERAAKDRPTLTEY